MTTAPSSPRRRVLRAPRADAQDVRRQRKIATRRARLDSEQHTLARWMTKLKRAFHAVEKQQRTITRLEREIAQLEAE
jgi:hypothetical protein